MRRQPRSLPQALLDAAHSARRTFGIDEDEQYQAHDLLSDERYRWRGPTAYVELSPSTKMAHIIKIRRW
ncbi:MAG: hypothetical protein V5B44_11200 [Candidatus Accumulibacter necessarius]|uniref:hypothetical protein n=1 Tax=Candidatus Accumulibacter necessarius TaxID=2954386 RepID=UPI002FC2AB93